MTYKYAMNRSDAKIIDKLNNLTNAENYWDDVRKLTKRIVSDRSIGRWQCLAEIRYIEIRYDEMLKEKIDG